MLPSFFCRGPDIAGRFLHRIDVTIASGTPGWRAKGEGRASSNEAHDRRRFARRVHQPGINSGCQLNGNIPARLPSNGVDLPLAQRGRKSAVDEETIVLGVSRQNMDACGSFR